MTIIHCPVCGSILTEPDYKKPNRIDCLMCSDNFHLENSKIAYANYTYLVEHLAEIHPEQLIRIVKELGLDIERKDKKENKKQKIKRDVEDAIKRIKKESDIEADETLIMTGRELFLEKIKSIKGDDADLL